MADANPYDATAFALAPAPPPAAPVSEKPVSVNPYDQVDLGLLSPGQQPPSEIQSFAHGAGANVGAAAGGFYGAGYGAEIGAAGGPVGAFAGALIGGVGGAFLAGRAQDYAVHSLPETWQDALGQSEQQQKLDLEYNGKSYLAGGLFAQALTMKPSFGAAALPENATNLERVLANPNFARLFGGALMGGNEAITEKLDHESPDWAKIGMATGFGLIFGRPNRIGETIERAGARTASDTRVLFGARPPAVPGAAPEAPAANAALGQPLPERPLAEEAEHEPGFSAISQLVGPIDDEPTLAQGGALNVLGPGDTEAVFLGSEQKDPAAEKTQIDALRDEDQALGRAPVESVDSRARRNEPDLFAHYDNLLQVQQMLRDEIAQRSAPAFHEIEDAKAEVAEAQAALDAHLEQAGGYAGGAEARRLRANVRSAQSDLDALNARPTMEQTPELEFARNHLQAVDHQLFDAGRAVAKARREAAESLGVPMEEQPGAPSAVPTAIQSPELREVLTRPAVAEAIAHPEINHNDDVPFGAGASNASHVTNIDRHIPQFDERVVDRTGKPADLWKYLNIHEQVEKAKMDEGVPYQEAHEKFATAAERAAVEADGVDWKKYTEVMDGFLSKIEHEKPENPPPDLYLKPYPEAKQNELLKASAPKSIEAQRAAIQQDVREKLTAAGRPAEEAESAAALTSALYETHAARLGAPSPEDLYRAEAPEIGARPVGRARGGLRLADGKSVLTLAADADASTYIHELGHDWIERIVRDAAREDAPAALKQDARTIRQALKVKGERIPRRAHEQFSRWFEQYMREGVAPSARLASVFANFRHWLLQIYQTIKGLGAPISDDIRGVFDRMLAEQPQRVVIAPERPGGPSLDEIHAADAREIEPADAEAGAERIAAERQRAIEDQPQEVAHEIAPVVAEVEAERTPVLEPAGEAPGGASGLREVERGGGEAGPEPAGRGVGAGSGAERQGGSGPATEGARLAYGTEPERRERSGSGPQPLAGRPADVFGPTATFNIGKDGNIRVENISSVPQLVQAIEESVERIGGSGAITMADMTNAADEFLIDPKQLTIEHLEKMFGGLKDLAPKLWALRVALRDQARRVYALSEQVRETSDDRSAVEYGVERARFDMMSQVLSSVTTESGRGLGMAYRNLEDWEKVADLQTIAKAATGRTLWQLKMEAKLGKNLRTPGQQAKWFRDAQKRSFGRMILEYWVNDLISGIPTHMTYLAANQMLTWERMGPETIAAALIGRLRQAGGRTGERVYAGEAAQAFKEYFNAQPKAAQAAIEALRTGQTVGLPGEDANVLRLLQGDEQILHIARTIGHVDVRWGEVKGDLYSAFRGLKDAVAANGALLASGGERGAPMLGAYYEPGGQIPNIAVKGVRLPVGTLMRLPSRGVASIHSFQRTLNFSIYKTQAAYREAFGRGLRGEELAAEVARLRQDPSQETMNAYAAHEATQATLMGSGGEFMQLLTRLTNWAPNLPLLGETPIFRFINPFIKIANAIIDQSLVHRTPLGLLRSEIRDDLLGKNGNIRQDIASAKMLMGAIYALTMGGLVAEGYATGSGPVDPRKRAVWMMAGNRAHSIRIGDVWYDTHRLGPIGMLTGVAADMYDVAHLMSEGDALNAAASLGHSFTQNMLDESFMRGPAELIMAVEDWHGYGQKYIRDQLSSFVPFSVEQSYTARAIDPYSRETRSIMDSIRAKIPFVSEGLQPRVDIFGENLPNPDALIARGLTAVYESKISHDPVNLALANIGVGIAKVPRTIRNVRLTDEQYHLFAQIAGRQLKFALNRVVGSPAWNNSTQEQQREIVAHVVEASRENARGSMLARYPQIGAAAVDAKRNRFR